MALVPAADSETAEVEAPQAQSRAAGAPVTDAFGAHPKGFGAWDAKVVVFCNGAGEAHGATVAKAVTAASEGAAMVATG